MRFQRFGALAPVVLATVLAFSAPAVAQMGGPMTGGQGRGPIMGQMTPEMRAQMQEQMGQHGMMGGPGMMGRGMMGAGMMGPGMMGGMGRMFGTRVLPRLDLTVEDVSYYLTRRLEAIGNDRLKLGKIEVKDDDTITAQIVTVDDSLVQALEVDRHTGWIDYE